MKHFPSFFYLFSEGIMKSELKTRELGGSVGSVRETTQTGALYKRQSRPPPPAPTKQI